MFTDSLGIRREVDVVVEGIFEGEPMTICFEVVEWSRKAGVTWVEGMIMKHRDLPTSRLILVSKSGFTPNALKKVHAWPGHVRAITPEFTDDGRVVKRLYLDELNYAPTAIKVCVLLEVEGAPREASVGESCTPATQIFDSEETELGTMGDLVSEIVHDEAVFQSLMTQAHNHPEKDSINAFSVSVPLISLLLCLRQSGTHNLHPITRLEITGNSAVRQVEVAFTNARLDQFEYASAHAPMAGRPAVWVATPNADGITATVSWQTTGAQVAPQTRTSDQPARHLSRFPGLTDLLARSTSRDGASNDAERSMIAGTTDHESQAPLLGAISYRADNPSQVADPTARAIHDG